jgi:hypothetical protein
VLNSPEFSSNSNLFVSKAIKTCRFGGFRRFMEAAKVLFVVSLLTFATNHLPTMYVLDLNRPTFGTLSSRVCVVLFVLFCFIIEANSQITAELQITHARCNGLRGKVLVADVTGGVAPYYFSLDGANFSTNPAIAQLQAGNHTLHLRDDFGHTGQLPFTIEQPDQLKAEIASTKSLVAPNESFSLAVDIYPPDAKIASITWRPDKYFVENRTQPLEVTILQHTTFAVEVRDSAQCVAYAQKEIRVHDSDMYFPNVISAKSTGNEVFTLYGASRVLNIKEMTIVDRYGTVVFRKTNLIPNDTSAGWNGRSKNKAVAQGVYFYQCILEMEDGSPQIVSGDITVLN